LYSCIVSFIFLLTVFFDLGSDPEEDRCLDEDPFEADFFLVGMPFLLNSSYSLETNLEKIVSGE